MRRIVIIGLTLALSGCGYKTWWNTPFTGGNNPNLPVSDSENMQRVLGVQPTVEPMTTEAGDIWPDKFESAPTLEDLEKSGGMTSQPEGPVAGSPLFRNGQPMMAPIPSQGSSTPPGNPPPSPTTPNPAAPLTSYKTPVTPPPPSGGTTGQVVQTPSGPSVVTGSGPSYQTTTSPSGGQSIIVPNGNGTSTVIHADGRIETIPTPK